MENFGIYNGFGLVPWSFSFDIDVENKEMTCERYKGNNSDIKFTLPYDANVHNRLVKIKEANKVDKHDYYESIFHELEEINQSIQYEKMIEEENKKPACSKCANYVVYGCYQEDNYCKLNGKKKTFVDSCKKFKRDA